VKTTDIEVTEAIPSLEDASAAFDLDAAPTMSGAELASSDPIPAVDVAAVGADVELGTSDGFDAPAPAVPADIGSDEELA
jgi:hypothetical protein